MKILIAEDERISRRLLEKTLQKWGHQVVVTCDGLEAWSALQQEDGPQLAILDWMMPGRDGLGVCRKVRETPETKSIYIILLTAKGETNDLIAGLDAGANDYVTKPFNREKLRARVQVGVRMVELQQATTADLKERERAEEALRKSEEQLRQSQKLEAVGQLAGGIAHDFNNLLTAITGYSQLSLRCLSPDDPLYRHIEEIMKAGNRAASLTRQLLAFSRKQLLQPRVLNLNSLVTNMGQMLGRLLPASIEFVTVLRPVGQINADPGQIEQVLMNLVVNARDAMAHRGKITIETGDVEIDDEYARRYDAIQPGPHVRLTVSDTGHGMDAETQKHIFEPFFTTKEIGKGTGLGLSTVYGIVKQSGGGIWVYSEIGIGTTFTVYLPRHMSKAESTSATPEPLVLLRGAETILLVEDEAVVRVLVRDILHESGYKVLEAARGADALRICSEHKEPIHLMLTDVVMPQMSGRELASSLAVLRPEIPVLYMSGYTDDAVIRDAALDPGAPLLEKPFTPAALSRKIRDMLDAVVISPLRGSEPTANAPTTRETMSKLANNWEMIFDA